MELFGTRLLQAASHRAELEAEYANYIREILAAPLWSEASPRGARIPWRLAKQAKGHHLFAEAFDSPGLYLFGSEAGVPLYLGKTRKKLWQRLARRYVNGERSQCQLAVTYEKELLVHGLRGFPMDIETWYRRSYRGSTVRLVGALTFAQHGIDGIWFTLIPINDPSQVGLLEKALIPVVDAWNRTHGYPTLLNLHYTSTWEAHAKAIRSVAETRRSAKASHRR